MLDALRAVMTKVHLHSADPGAADSNTNELTIGTYQRKTTLWNAASGGAIDDNNGAGLVFDIPAGATVAWISWWNGADTVRYAKKQVTTEVFGGVGTYTLTDTDFDLNDP